MQIHRTLPSRCALDIIVSMIAFITLFQAAFGVLGIVAVSCVVTISGRVEERLNRKQKNGSSALEEIERAGIPTTSVSHEVYYNSNDRKLIEHLQNIAVRWALVYCIFFGLSLFFAALRWRGIIMDEFLPLFPALGFTLWLVIDIWITFRDYLKDVVESVSEPPRRS